MITLSTLVLFQNCTPANFTALKSNDDRGGFGEPICPDPENPACVIPPPPSCRGFDAIPIGDVVIPFGQASQNVSITGTLGQARGPIQWEVPGANPATNVGLVVNFEVAPRRQPYTVTARSSDNVCVDSFSFQVSQGQCTNPSATQIQANITTPLDSRRINTPILFAIPNFSNLQNVEVSYDNKVTYSPVSRSEFTHTFTTTGNFTVWLKAKDRNCENILEVQVPITILPEVCVPDVTTLMAERITSDPRSGSPVEFRVNTDFNLLENNRVEVICDPGMVSYYGQGDRILCNYPASQQDIEKLVTIRAIGKKCRNNLETNFEFLLKKQCDALPAIQVAVAPSQSVFPTTSVQFTVANAAAYNRAGVTFNWNLGNGTTGSGTSIPATTYPLTTAEEDIAATQGVLRNTRFYLQSTDPTICVPNDLQIPITVRLTSQTQEFVVGQQTSKPPVKLFFIVDNSNTMRDDQQRLSQSFGTLFSQANSANLTQFNTSTWVFNTAQKNDPWMSARDDFGHPRPSELEYYYNSNISAANLTPEQISTQVTSNRLLTPLTSQQYNPDGSYEYIQNCQLGTLDGARATSNGIDPGTPSCTYGHVSGDVIGYRNSAGSGAQFYQFDIMPVSLLRAGPGGANALPQLVSRSSSLPMGANPALVSQYSQDFSERVSILNPFLYSSEKWDPILTQHESGLCAAARILQSGQYIQQGDQASFVIVSDENDQDPMGNNCLSASGNVTIEYGRCAQRGTRFGYQTPASCRMDYPNSVRLTYSWRVFRAYVTQNICTQYDDQGNCVRYTQSGHYINLPGTSGNPVEYCNTYEAQNPGSQCSYNDESGTLTRPFVPNLVSGGACDSATEQQLVSTVSSYVRNSCRVSGYNLTYAESSQHGSSEAICRAELLVRQPYCANVTNPSVCRSFLDRDYATLEVPVTGLSCDSQCPAGQSSYCGTRSIRERINALSPGSNCSVISSNTAMTGSSFMGPEISFAPNVPVSARCEASRVWSATRTQQIETNTYVATNTQGQRVSLKDYILEKTNVLAAAGLKPTFSTFTLKQGDTPGAGESVGTAYIDLVNSVGMPSLSFSLNQQDFTYPMQVLSQYIQTILSTVFDFNLPGGARIRTLTWERTGQTPRPVRADSYQLSGGRIEFLDVDTVASGVQIWLADGTKISLQLNDKFRVTYY